MKLPSETPDRPQWNWNAMVIAPEDNVAVALCDLAGAARLRLGEEIRIISLKSPVPIGHKFAIRNLECGASILKYGECIGLATRAIAMGEHVHVQNLQSLRARSRE